MPVTLNIEIRTVSVCEYVVVTNHFNFATLPVVGDVIELNCDNKLIRTTVTSRTHTNDGQLIINCVIDCVYGYDIIKALIKLTNGTEAYSIGIDNRTSHHIVSGIISKLFGKDHFDTNSDHPSALAELIGAVVRASGYSDYNKIILDVLQYIIGHKKSNTSIGISDIMCHIDHTYDVCDLVKQVDYDCIVRCVSDSFSNLKSIPNDKLPLCLRSEL